MGRANITCFPLNDTASEVIGYAVDDIAYERSGSGPPMLLLHGCPATRTLWSPVVPALARHRTIVALDLPGFGASPLPAEPDAMSLESLVTTLLDFASRRGFDRFDLVGHSFGGAIGASIAAAAPERITSLAMIAPMGFEMPPAARLARTRLVRGAAPALWRLLPHVLRRAIVRASSRANYGPAHRPERARQIAGELDRDDALRAVTWLVGGFDYDEYRRRLERLEAERHVPTMLVGARRDRIVPFAHFESLCTLMPDARRCEYDDGVHVLMWQHPDRLAREIVEFAGEAERRLTIQGA
jgi:pimeloyl-ACP methyl ester carboxylesterase